MTAVWERSDLSQSQTLVALALADHANDLGLCWPSIERIALKARISQRQVQRIIKQLESLGIVTINRGGRGAKSTNQFRFSIKGDTVSPIPETRVTPEALRVTPMTNKGDTAMSPESPLTIKESSWEDAINASAKRGEKTNLVLAGEVIARIRKKVGRHG